MKTFSEIITEADDKDSSSRKPFRLVVLADRPKSIKDNASSTKNAIGLASYVKRNLPSLYF